MLIIEEVNETIGLFLEWIDELSIRPYPGMATFLRSRLEMR